MDILRDYRRYIGEFTHHHDVNYPSDFCYRLWEQVKAEEQINYLTKASIGYGIEKRVGKRQK
ncbi:hypothetical protein [Microcystis aeruginosa]|uniref:hypothetical protein n=1 Tax=Microcystis aeruginosa TaxID=1126 RepID=UPI001C85BBD9|nr:hypothetical protein [Microcystis aeruginosa]